MSQDQTQSIIWNMSKSLYQGKGNHSQTRRQQKKSVNEEVSAGLKKKNEKKKKEPELVSTVMFTSFSNYPLGCGHEVVIVVGFCCCCEHSVYFLE